MDPPDDRQEISPALRSRLLRWAPRLLAAAFLLALVGSAALYFSRDWLASQTRAIFKAGFARRGLYLDSESSSFSPLRGLVLEDVRIFPTAEKISPLLSASNLAVAVNPFRRTAQSGLDARITSDSATFEFHHPEHPFLLERVDLELHTSLNQIHLDRFEGRTGGVALDLSGGFALDDVSPPPDTQQAGEPATGETIAGLDLEPVAKILSLLEVAPRGAPLEIRAYLVRLQGGAFGAKGKTSGRRFSWRKADIDSIDAAFETLPRPDASNAPGEITAISFPSIEAGYAGKTLRASATHTLATNTIRFDSLKSTIDPLSLMRALAPAAVESLSALRLDPPPEISLSGSVSLGNFKNSALTGSIANGGVIVALDPNRELRFSEVAGAFTLSGGSLATPDLAAKVFDGSLLAAATLRPFEQPAQLGGTLIVKELSVREIAALSNGSEGGPGRIDADFEGGGTPSLYGLAGSGHVHLTGAQSVSIPVLRNFFGAIRKVIPGLKPSEEGSSLLASYALRDGIVTSDDIQLESGGIAANATASIDLRKRHVNGTANARTKGVSGLVTGLAGKALEMEGEGPFGAIEWRFKNIPGLANGAANVVTGGAKGMKGAATGGAKGVKDAATGLVKGIGGVAKKAGKALSSGDKLNPSPENLPPETVPLETVPPENPPPSAQEKPSSPETPSTNPAPTE